MNYEEALQYISNTNRFGIKLGLETVTRLLELLGNPQENLNIIHVAGTNGKGSVCSFISNILIDAGYSVGLYTSPYLENFTERIRVDQNEIPKEEVANIVNIIDKKISIMLKEGYSNPTEFEIVTAMALYYYNLCNVDYVVLEVGLGGRYDATNVIKESLVSVITSISLDHIGVLGDTISKIAYEKAGIIKNSGTVVVYKQEYEAEEVIREICRKKDAKYIGVDFDSIEIVRSDINTQVFNYTSSTYEYKNLEMKLIGEHQIKNAILAINVIEYLNIHKKINVNIENIKTGLLDTKWPGRIEIIKEAPLFIIDGAHNLDGAKSLAKVLEKNFSDKKETLIIGMLKDKEIDSVLEVLTPYFNKVIVTYPISDRSMEVDDLKIKISNYIEDVVAIKDINDAVNLALKNANKDDVIIAAGSLYMIGAIRTIVKNIE
ncbi:bifunctional folylpolyglutamate synthase/dihydrofolate synthase [Clostridioides mangenotii]|uniref:bifunctional folylpolyglutamate synthase/dihydrofolate synthase n=1 Tax=Metaclostridioides mangenotii TaxID=1540 RepID=UPI001C112B68|nr:folylpolyglutamate synthase/dihydrofolate synthase family protein [Clostridioides mangenotii]MBU5307098.1 bifunctional folylpolyglutamate synthase/dihydrofolate synthase [Clostridioides mangenotii]MCR1953894.1 bifunctional folylpolyglutamate synthase/dihydrofolate synthase [Clostridioides mangenotii]